jgi:nitrogen fixation protein FixH
MTVTPGQVGVNRFDARISDYDTGKPVPATSVTLQLSLPGNPNVGNPELDLKRSGSPGVWTGSGTVLSIFGRWQADMVIQQPSGGVEVPLEIQPRLPTENITSASAPGQPTVYTIGLPAAAQLQTYIDPGKTGTNNVHFTFFGSNGREMPIQSATASALAPDGSTQPLPLKRFSAGHFVANTSLDKGTWLFLIDATAKAGGTAYNGYFKQAIP